MRKDRFNQKRWFKLLLGAASVLFLVALCYFVGRPLTQFVSEPEQFRLWVEEKGFLGIVIFIGMNILQVFLAIIPGGPFEVGAGYAFGVVKGTIICEIAMTTASILIFVLVRRFGMHFVELFVSREKIESVNILKSSRHKESILFLLFLIPGTPKDLMSYLIGLTDMKLSHWIFISAVGRLPAIFLSVLSGSALGSSQYSAAAASFTVMIVLYVTGLILYRFHVRRRS